MATAPVPIQAKLAMAAVCGLIFFKVMLLRSWIMTTSRTDVLVAMRQLLLGPVPLAIGLATFAWVGWVTWQLGKADNDIRGLLKVLLAFDAFLFLLVFSIDRLPF